MRNLRMYADRNGESHLEEVSVTYNPVEYAPPAPPFGVSDPIDSARYVSVQFPAGWTSGLHPSPQRQLFVMLAGELEGEMSDGTKASLVAGDTLLMEDTEGKGHTAKVIGEKDVYALMVHLE